MATRLSLCSSARYQIVVGGVLGNTWQERFDDLELSIDEITGCTILEGVIRDQAQLIGLLKWLNGLAMPIVKVECLAVTEPDGKC